MTCPVCLTDTSHWVRLQCGGQSPSSYGLRLVPTNPSSIHPVGHMCCSPCVSKFTRAECHECRAPFDIRMSISRRLLLSRLLLTNLCPIPTGVGYVLKTYPPSCDHATELGHLRRVNSELKRKNEDLFSAYWALETQAKQAMSELEKEKSTSDELRAGLRTLQSVLSALSSDVGHLIAPVLSSNTPHIPEEPEPVTSSVQVNGNREQTNATGSPCTQASLEDTTGQRHTLPLPRRVRRPVVSSRPTSQVSPASRVITPSHEGELVAGSPPVTVTATNSRSTPPTPSSCTQQTSPRPDLQRVKVSTNGRPQAPVATITSSGCTNGGPHGNWNYRGTNRYARKYNCGRCGYRVDERPKRDEHGVEFWCNVRDLHT